MRLLLESTLALDGQLGRPRRSKVSISGDTSCGSRVSYMLDDLPGKGWAFVELRRRRLKSGGIFSNGRAGPPHQNLRARARAAKMVGQSHVISRAWSEMTKRRGPGAGGAPPCPAMTDGESKQTRSSSTHRADSPTFTLHELCDNQPPWHLPRCLRPDACANQ